MRARRTTGRARPAHAPRFARQGPGRRSAARPWRIRVAGRRVPTGAREARAPSPTARATRRRTRGPRVRSRGEGTAGLRAAGEGGAMAWGVTGPAYYRSPARRAPDRVDRDHVRPDELRPLRPAGRDDAELSRM